MTVTLDQVVLIDDNAADNFLHRRAIKQTLMVNDVRDYLSAEDALADIASHAVTPDIIFLDINMPGMNGWDFMEEFRKLPPLPKQPIFVLMLTTSLNPDDREKASETGSVRDFLSKPLTSEVAAQLFTELLG